MTKLNGICYPENYARPNKKEYQGGHCILFLQNENASDFLQAENCCIDEKKISEKCYSIFMVCDYLGPKECCSIPFLQNRTNSILDIEKNGVKLRLCYDTAYCTAALYYIP
jgi:hypothetical protein